MQETIYVFGIIQGPVDINSAKTNLGGRETDIYTVKHKDISAIITRVPAKDYEPSAQNVLAHQKVIEKIMGKKTIVPMSFGTTFNKEGDVVELLKQTYTELKQVLKKIEGKIELGVKAFWNQDEMIKKIVEENPEINPGQNPDYNSKILTGQLIDSALTEYRQQYIDDIHNELKDYAVASRINKNIGEEMLLNAAFLVEKEREEEFDQKMNELGLRYENMLDFKYTGPWPAYNFVNVKLQIKEGD